MPNYVIFSIDNSDGFTCRPDLDIYWVGGLRDGANQG
jgi:hypothetical protein